MCDGKVFDQMDRLNLQVAELERENINLREVNRRFQVKNNDGINKGDKF